MDGLHRPQNDILDQPHKRSKFHRGKKSFFRDIAREPTVGLAKYVNLVNLCTTQSIRAENFTNAIEDLQVNLGPNLIWNLFTTLANSMFGSALGR
ncbi:hypothetical protein Y032_0023g739 [Ancylostoma ceylanicum]|uniref:Uncharacterized protein n=1 Tax=Ancylostoma ceylanicum TaxID=53326 RepID=A0A016UYG0_9BILA|nr:hypothetical protein Y032_0023g739 [Ancylostoma ceylanicum]